MNISYLSDDEDEDIKQEILDDLLLDSTKCDPIDPQDEAEINRIIKQEVNDEFEFKCRCCKFVADSFDLLEKHENGHRARGTFLECEYCEFCTNTREVMIQHVTKHTGERPFKCTKCTFCSRWKRDLIKHQVKHSDEKKYMCSQCDFRTKWYNNIRHHQVIHTTNRPFTCHICDMKFKRKTGLDYHLYRHNDYKPKKCSKCDFRCKTNFELKYHQHKHSEIRNYPCTFPGCVQKCKTRSDLNKHVKIHTNVRDKVCDICNKGFVTLSNLSKHKLRHVTERKFKCDLCATKFKTRTSLRHHLQTHTDYKPFSCDVCGHQFRNRHNMNTHKLTHSTDRKFKCPICPYAGKFPFHIFAHIGTFHGDQFAYFCEICRKPFSRYSQLQTHCGRMHKGCDLLSAKPQIKEEILEEHIIDPSKQDSRCLKMSNAKLDNVPSLTEKENMRTESEQSIAEISSPIPPMPEDSKSLPEKAQSNDITDDPNVIIYNIGPFRLPLASKGFNFNFEKTGKKPKNWFMEPQYMTDNQAAEKQRAYIEKKARNVERSRGATIRKFKWKKPPFKPSLEENPRYKRERELKKKQRETGRTFVKQEPELEELINIGRSNIRKIKICKRAGQLMKNWKELEVKLEKLDGFDEQCRFKTTDTFEKKTTSVELQNMSEPALTIDNSLNLPNTSIPLLTSEMKKRTLDGLESNLKTKKRKVLLKERVKKKPPKKTVQKKRGRKPKANVPECCEPQKMKKRVGRPRKYPVKDITLETNKIKSVNDLIIPLLPNVTDESIEQSESTKESRKLDTSLNTLNSDSPYINSVLQNDKSSKMLAPELVQAACNTLAVTKPKDTTHKSTGRLTLAIDKLIAKQSKEVTSSHSPSPTEQVVHVQEIILSQIQSSAADMKRHRKSESPRKVKKIYKTALSSSTVEPIFTDEDDLPLSILIQKQPKEVFPKLLMSEIKTEPLDYIDVDEGPLKLLKQTVDRLPKTSKTSSQPHAHIKRNADKCQGDDSCKKILEDLLRQPVRKKRADLGVMESSMESEKVVNESTYNNQTPSETDQRHSKFDQSLTRSINLSFIFQNVTLRDLLLKEPINYPRLALITTDLVGPEPDKNVCQIDIDQATDKDELIKIKKTLRNEKYRLKKLAPGSSTIKQITSLIQTGRNISCPPSTSSNYPILKNVLMRNKDSDSDNDVLITDDHDLFKKRKPIKLCLKKTDDCNFDSTDKAKVTHKNKEKLTEYKTIKPKKRLQSPKPKQNFKLKHVASSSNIPQINTGSERICDDTDAGMPNKNISIELSENLSSASSITFPKIKRKYIKKSAFWISKRIKGGLKNIGVKGATKKKKSPVKSLKKQKMKTVISTEQQQIMSRLSPDYTVQSSTSTDIKQVLQSYITNRRNKSLKKKKEKNIKSLKMTIKKGKKGLCQAKKDKIKKKIKKKSLKKKTSKQSKIIKKKRTKRKKNLLKVKLPVREKSNNVEIYVDVEDSELLDNEQQDLNICTSMPDHPSEQAMETGTAVLVLPDDKFELLLTSASIKTEPDVEEEPAIKNEYWELVSDVKDGLDIETDLLPKIESVVNNYTSDDISTYIDFNSDFTEAECYNLVCPKENISVIKDEISAEIDTNTPDTIFLKMEK